MPGSPILNLAFSRSNCKMLWERLRDIFKKKGVVICIAQNWNALNITVGKWQNLLTPFLDLQKNDKIYYNFSCVNKFLSCLQFEREIGRLEIGEPDTIYEYCWKTFVIGEIYSWNWNHVRTLVNHTAHAAGVADAAGKVRPLWLEYLLW